MNEVDCVDMDVGVGVGVGVACRRHACSDVAVERIGFF